MDKYPKMRPLSFYVGQFLNIFGVVSYVVGISSDSWIVMSPSGPDVSVSRKETFVSRYGPFVACNYGGACDHPWVVLGGVDQISVKVVQVLLILAAILYLLGLMVMLLQATLPKPVLYRWKSLGNQIIVELVHPCAAVTGFTAMLLMGEVKRKVIAQGHQSEHVGSGFMVTLAAIAVTVAGSVCMILNRNVVDESRMACYLIKYKRFKRALRLTKRTVKRPKSVVPRTVLSDVNVFMTDGSCSDTENQVIVSSADDTTNAVATSCSGQQTLISLDGCSAKQAVDGNLKISGTGLMHSKKTLAEKVQENPRKYGPKLLLTEEHSSQDSDIKSTLWSDWGEGESFRVTDNYTTIQSNHNQMVGNTVVAAAAAAATGPKGDPSSQESHMDLSIIWALSVPQGGNRNSSRGHARAWQLNDSQAVASQSQSPSAINLHCSPIRSQESSPSTRSAASAKGESESTGNFHRRTKEMACSSMAWGGQ